MNKSLSPLPELYDSEAVGEAVDLLQEAENLLGDLQLEAPLDTTEGELQWRSFGIALESIEEAIKVLWPFLNKKERKNGS